MKKQKSMVILSILTAVVSICLILNIFFEKRESNCINRLETLKNNLTVQRFDNIHAQLNWIFLQSSLMEQNLSYLNLDVKDRILKTTVDISAVNLTKGIWDDMGEVQKRIRVKEEEIKIKRNECNQQSLYGSVAISLAFVLNILAFGCGILIYRLYKT